MLLIIGFRFILIFSALVINEFIKIYYLIGKECEQ